MCNTKQKSLKANIKKKNLCRAPKVSARQRDAFAERQTSALGKEMSLPSA
jgi:hypothetical protein